MYLDIRLCITQSPPPDPCDFDVDTIRLVAAAAPLYPSLPAGRSSFIKDRPRQGRQAQHARGGWCCVPDDGSQCQILVSENFSGVLIIVGLGLPGGMSLLRENSHRLKLGKPPKQYRNNYQN
eukprot:8869016-Pyramimonas_sp.AAC.1